MIDKINKILKNGFKTKQDYFRFFLANIIILFSLILFNNLYLVCLLILIYSVGEYIIEKKRH